MKRILSFLMVLVMVTGVCLCISSCEEAEDTSSPDRSAGYDIIAKSAVGNAWKDYVRGSKTKTIQTLIGSEVYMVYLVGSGEEDFIRSMDKIAQTNDILIELESHIVKELTDDEVQKIDEQRLIENSGKTLVDLAQLTMYDFSPELSEDGFFVDITGECASININEKYFSYLSLDENSSLKKKACFELDGDVASIVGKIKSIRER